MNKEVEDFPLKTKSELPLSSDEVNQIKEEIPSNKEFNDASTNQQAHSASIHQKGIFQKTLSNILDPNKFYFSKVIRIAASGFKFVNLLKNTKINKACRKSKGLENATDKEIQPISEKRHRFT